MPLCQSGYLQMRFSDVFRLFAAAAAHMPLLFLPLLTYFFISRRHIFFFRFRAIRYADISYYFIATLVSMRLITP